MGETIADHVQNQVSNRIYDNPYYQRNPIKDPNAFYGRTDKVKEILNSLRRDQCVSVVGPRRIGKTSLLNYISHPQVMAKHNLAHDYYILVPIDCQGLGHFTASDLYGLMLEETAHRLETVGLPSDLVPEWSHPSEVGSQPVDDHSLYEIGLSKLLNRTEIGHSHHSEVHVYQQRLSENITRTRRYGDTDTQRAERAEIIDRLNEVALSALGISFTELCEPFRSNNKKVLAKRAHLGFVEFKQAIKRMQETDLRLAYLLDEFELLVENKNLDRDFFAGLRSIAENYHVAYITATHIQLHELASHKSEVLGSPFFNIFRNLTLGLMPEAEALRLITEPSHRLFNQADVEFLLEMAGSHPFFLQIAAYHLFDVRRREVRGQKTALSEWAASAQASDRFTDEAESHFYHIWGHLTPSEKQLVNDLLHTRKVLNGQQGTLQSLERKCLVQNERIFSEAFANFARSQLAQPILSDPVGDELADSPAGESGKDG